MNSGATTAQISNTTRSWTRNRTGAPSVRGVDPVHRRLRPFGDDELDGVGRVLDGLGKNLSLIHI